MTLNCLHPTAFHLMTSTDFHAMLVCMETNGGKFVSSLATALRYADPHNRQRLLSEFAEIVEKYGPNTILTMQPASHLTLVP